MSYLKRKLKRLWVLNENKWFQINKCLCGTVYIVYIDHIVTICGKSKCLDSVVRSHSEMCG